MPTRTYGSTTGTNVWFRFAALVLGAAFIIPTAEARQVRLSSGSARVMTTPLDLLEMTDASTRVFRGRVQSVDLMARADDPSTSLVRINFQVEAWLKPRGHRAQEVTVWQHPSVRTELERGDDVLWFLGVDSIEAELIAPIGITSGDFRVYEEGGRTWAENLNGNAALWRGHLWKRVSMEAARRSLLAAGLKSDRIDELLELGKKDCSAHPLPYEFIAAIVEAHLSPMQH